MKWTILKVKDQELINGLLRDDIVSRQSVTTRDDADGWKIILVEGSDEALDRVNELAPDVAIGGEDAQEWYNRIKSEESAVASGVGMIFD
jgi:histidinol dehydrogenase